MTVTEDCCWIALGELAEQSSTGSVRLAPVPPRSCAGISSGRWRVPLPSRWARCWRAEERQTEAKA